MNLIRPDSSTLSIFVPFKDGYERIFTRDILFAKASGSYTLIQTESGSFLLSTNLGKLSEKLTQATFLRVHKSYVVNIHRIESLSSTAVIVGTHKVPINNEVKQELFRYFNVISPR